MSRLVSPPLTELDNLRPPLTPGERRVLECFHAILPEIWEIYLQPHLNGLKPDFVLLNPDTGIAVYEVKDWNLNAMPFRWEHTGHGRQVLLRQNKQGRWYREEDPLQKIFFYKQQVIELYAPSLQDTQLSSDALKIVTGGLIFPNASREDIDSFFDPVLANSWQGKYPQNNPIVAREDLESGDLSKIFPEGRRIASHIMSDAGAREMRAWLTEPEHTKSQRTPLPLDARQREIVSRRTATGYQRLRGPAGSGKTHVLAAKAALLASEGKRVLVITFNITLINYIRDLIVRAALPKTGVLKHIDLYSFHAWCKWLCHEYGYESEYNDLWRGGDNHEDALAEGLADLTQRAIASLNDSPLVKGIGYDVVLVDEGQDYRLSWWQTVTRACKELGEKILVADMTQDLYETAGAWTDEAMTGAGFRGPWAELKTAYRLPPQLVPLVREFAERYLPGAGRNLPQAQQLELGSQIYLRWLQIPESELVLTATQAVLDMPALTETDPVAYSDVVLLTDRKEIGWDIVGKLGGKGIKVAHTFGKDDKVNRRSKRKFFMGAEKIKGTTFHSFKGWEARYLVVCVTTMEKQTDWAALYVALTRLKLSDFGPSYLTVVCAAPQLEEYGSTWPKP